MEKLYKVMEFTTTGWEVPGDEYKGLTKERAKELINYLLNEGVSPDKIKAVPDSK
tara:strand:+ start:2687 stop:2851 length:165 start_codon:yes stop_codon:yes gene_type:complete